MNTQRVDSPVMVTISHITQETPNVRTFTLDYALGSQPGQFVMMWIPGIDQKPFSINNDTGDQFQLTIFAIGPTTEALFELEVGDKVGITGPYGTGFTYEENTHLITIGGGYGAAPLAYFTEQAIADGHTVDFCVGARSEEHLLFEDRMAEHGAAVHVSTDDGSKGFNGYVTDVVRKLLEQRKADGTLEGTVLYTCGPELMEKKVAEMAQEFGIQSQVSIERYMKCGFGVCGNCCVDDDGAPMCVKGPVVSGEYALGLSEFGVHHRDKTGTRHEY